VQTLKASVFGVAGVVMIAAAAAAGDTLHVKGGDVAVTCPLTVGGSFEAKTDVVTGEVTVANPDEPLDGALLVDLQSLETGIGLRDRHMKSNYLEVERGAEYAAARLEEIRIERLSGKTTFRGLLTLHGERREVTGTAEIKPTASGYRVDANFPVRMSEFRIPDATYLGVGVKNEVQVRVNFTAARPAATGSR
jgi:polyisoprenoid-binding protein YceI